MSPVIPARVLFSIRLAAFRAERGLSQRGLGDEMGLGKRVGSVRINRYERQERFPALDDLDLLANTLNIPVAALLALDDSTARAICALARLTDAEREEAARKLEELAGRSAASDNA